MASKSPSNLEIALHYHSLGYNVIPAQPRGKAPALETWREYQTRKSTEDEIRQWWTENPRYNIGAITGRVSGIVVVDVDDPEKAMPSLMGYRTQQIAVSGSGKGYHLYYRYPDYADTIPNRVKFLQGADVRADGGFIILPPSVHSSGAVYAYASEGDMPELPRGLYDLIMTRLANQPEENDQTNWVATLLSEGSKSGSRDSDATRLAGYLASIRTPRDIALVILRGWYDRTDQNGFPWSQVEKCVQSVYTKEAVNPGQDNSPAAPQRPSLDALVTPMVDLFGAVNEIQWMIEGWMPKASTSLMVAPPGTYKTWIMISICVAIGTGYPFLGAYKTKQGRALLIQAEDGAALLKQRYMAIYTNMVADNHRYNPREVDPGVWEMDLPINPQVDVWTANYLLSFADDGDMDMLEELIRVKGYTFVALDPLYAFADADDYMSAAAQKMVRLKQIRERYGVTFLVLHHTRKSSAKVNDKNGGIERQDAWGSAFLNAWLEFGIQIRAIEGEDNKVRVLRHGKMSPGLLPVTLSMDISIPTLVDETQTSTYTVTVEDVLKVDISGITDDRTPASVDVNTDEAAVMQLAVQQGGVVRSKDVTAALGLPPSTASKRLRQLVEKGKMVKRDDGSYKVVAH
jgi:hypothetical protein